MQGAEPMWRIRRRMQRLGRAIGCSLLLGAIGCNEHDGSAKSDATVAATHGSTTPESRAAAGSASAPSVSSAGEPGPSSRAAAPLGAHFQGCEREHSELSYFAGPKDLDPMGTLSRPEDSEPGTLPLLVHFHGQIGAMLELDHARTDVFLVGLSLSPGTYRRHFGARGVMPSFMKHAKRAASPYLADDAMVLVSAWSNGYEAVRSGLDQKALDPDGIILLDALHGDSDDDNRRLQLASMAAYAQRARRGERFMWISHTSVETDDYASTTTSVDTVIEALGGELPAFEPPPLAGERTVRGLHEGGLYIVGHSGDDETAHCRQIVLLPYAVERAFAWQAKR